MANTDQERKLLALWQRAVTECEKGNRDAGTYFNRAELDCLASLGMNAREVYDFAEDHVAYGEPDFANFRGSAFNQSIRLILPQPRRVHE